MSIDNSKNPMNNNPLNNNGDSAKKIADHTADNKLPAPDSLTTGNTHDQKDTLRTEQNKTGNQTASKRKDGGYLELLEERPVINKERLDVGKVTVTKHTRTKTIDVPIELVEEYVTIATAYNDAESQDLLSGNYDDKDILRHVEPSLDSKAVVTINGQQVEISDEPVEIVISRQVATVTKDTYAIQEVEINKTIHTHTDTIQVELKHEELDVKEEGFLEHEATRVQQK